MCADSSLITSRVSQGLDRQGRGYKTFPTVIVCMSSKSQSTIVGIHQDDSFLMMRVGAPGYLSMVPGTELRRKHHPYNRPNVSTNGSNEHVSGTMSRRPLPLRKLVCVHRSRLFLPWPMSHGLLMLSFNFHSSLSHVILIRLQTIATYHPSCDQRASTSCSSGERGAGRCINSRLRCGH